jgi:hypothetical protein
MKHENLLRAPKVSKPILEERSDANRGSTRSDATARGIGDAHVSLALTWKRA